MWVLPKGSICFTKSKTGASSSPTCASFLPINKTPGAEQSFLEAIRKKYGHVETPEVETRLSRSKVVENVGFQKVQDQLGQLDKLEIVLVDGHGIKNAESAERILKTCPRIVELDLSRNLFDDYLDIIRICGALEHLRRLRLR